MARPTQPGLGRPSLMIKKGGPITDQKNKINERIPQPFKMANSLSQQDEKYPVWAAETSITYVFFTHRLKYMLNTQCSSRRAMEVFSFKGSFGGKKSGTTWLLWNIDRFHTCLKAWTSYACSQCGR